MEKNNRVFATYSIILRTNRINKLNEHPICIKVTKDGKTSIAATVYSSKPKDWNSTIQRPKPRHPDYNELNQYLEKVSALLKSIITDLQQTTHEYSSVDVISQFKSPLQSSTAVNSFYEKLMKRMLDKNQHSTYYTYKSAFYWLNKFKPLDNLTFAEINYSFLEDLQAFIIKEKPGVKGSTLFGYFKNYKAFMRSAINEELVKEGVSNFTKFSLSRFSTESVPLTLDIKHINALWAMDLEPYTSRWDARNYFVFSFFCGGINLTDIAKLTISDMNNGRIAYTRSKSDIHCKFKLNEISTAIINSYKGLTYGDYLFPILRKEYTPKQLFTRIKSASKQVNKSLRDIGANIGIKELHFYAARHTIATTMKFMEIPTNAIAETIGHANERTTKKYLRKFHDNKLEEINDRVYNKVTGKTNQNTSIIQ